MKAETAQSMLENGRPCEVVKQKFPERERQGQPGEASRGQDMEGLSCHTGEPAIRPESFT